MPTLLDGLTVELILNSDYFRGRLCAAFRRAARHAMCRSSWCRSWNGCAMNLAISIRVLSRLYHSAASSAGLTLVLVCTLAPRGITDGEGPRGE